MFSYKSILFVTKMMFSNNKSPLLVTKTTLLVTKRTVNSWLLVSIGPVQVQYRSSSDQVQLQFRSESIGKICN